MSKMAEIDYEIREALDTYRKLSCEEIACLLGIPLEFVHQVVEARWNEIIGRVSQ
jgi:hypothetical protein